MFCPNCGHEQYCPCGSCFIERDRKGEASSKANPWKELDNDLISCSKCNLTAHIDWWSSLESDIHTKLGLIKLFHEQKESKDNG